MSELLRNTKTWHVCHITTCHVCCIKTSHICHNKTCHVRCIKTVLSDLVVFFSLKIDQFFLISFLWRFLWSSFVIGRFVYPEDWGDLSLGGAGSGAGPQLLKQKKNQNQTKLKLLKGMEKQNKVKLIHKKYVVSCTKVEVRLQNFQKKKQSKGTL